MASVLITESHKVEELLMLINLTDRYQTYLQYSHYSGPARCFFDTTV